MFQPRVSPKQAQVINDQKRFILVSGARSSSKSYGVLHSIAWRMWNIPNYVGCMVGSTTSQSIDSGLWSILTEKVLPDWIEGRMYSGVGPDSVLLPEEDWQPFGMEWITKPRSQSITHKMFFDVSNKWGGKSRLYLDSLDVETDVEKRFKGRVFCDVILSEASNFVLRETFDCLKLCLRDYPPEQLRFILDTNPALYEPESHWIFKLFFEFAGIDLENPPDTFVEQWGLNGLDEESRAITIKSLKELQANLSVHEFSVNDNCFISEEEKRALYAAFAHSKDSLDRNFWGKWVRGGADGIFADVFRREIHVVGERATPANPEPEIMLPQEHCVELGGGWDIGSRRNSAFVIVEPFLTEVEEYGQPILRPAFKVLDCYVNVGKQQKIWEIAEEALTRVEKWSGHCKQWPIWHHISDSSAFDVSGQTETSEAQDIFLLTNGKIELKSVVVPGLSMRGPAIKGQGGIERGIELVQRLLFENRLFVNEATCHEVVEMLATIKRNRQGKLAPTNPQKHVLDALRYYLAWKCWVEMRKTSPRLSTDPEGGVLAAAL